jgi:hypothetical protein
MSRFSTWLTTLGGGRPDVLVDVPGSGQRFQSLGGVLLGTASVAALSAAFAFHMALGLPFVMAVIAGGAWGFLILTLDRALVQTMSNQRGWLANILAIVPRILIALVLGVVISTPLVLRIFEKEIDSQLVTMHQAAVDEFEKAQQSNTLYAQIPALQAQISALQAQVDAPPSIDTTKDPRVQNAQAELAAATAAVAAAQAGVTSPTSADPATDPRVKDAQAGYDSALADYNTKHAAAQCELDGTCGTGRAGEGDAYRAAKAAEDSAKATLDQAAKELTAAKDAAVAAGESGSNEARALAGTELSKSQDRLRNAQAELASAQSAAAVDLTRSTSDSKTTAGAKLSELTTQLAALQGADAAARVQFDAVLANDDGILARLEALSRLGDQNSTMRTAQTLLALLFVLIEIAPVLMKAMMNLGSKFTYDDVLQARDAALKAALAASDRVTVDRAEADAQLARDQHQDLIQRQLESTQTVNAEVVDVQKEVMGHALAEWRERALEYAYVELARYRSEPERYPSEPAAPDEMTDDIDDEFVDDRRSGPRWRWMKRWPFLA